MLKVRVMKTKVTKTMMSSEARSINLANPAKRDVSALRQVVAEGMVLLAASDATGCTSFAAHRSTHLAAQRRDPGFTQSSEPAELIL